MAPQGGLSNEQTPLLGGDDRDGGSYSDDLDGEPQPCKEVPPQVCVRLYPVSVMLCCQADRVCIACYHCGSHVTMSHRYILILYLKRFM